MSGTCRTSKKGDPPISSARAPRGRSPRSVPAIFVALGLTLGTGAQAPVQAATLEAPTAESVTAPGAISGTGTASAEDFRIKSAEICMMRRINERRVRHGRPRLKSDAHLIYVARRHARTMASAGSIYHDDRLGRRITRWRRLGQNVGTGGDCGSLMRAFMRSDAHRSNVLGTWRHLGVGVQRSDGRIYVQQIFESRFDPGNVYNYP